MDKRKLRKQWQFNEQIPRKSLGISFWGNMSFPKSALPLKRKISLKRRILRVTNQELLHVN